MHAAPAIRYPVARSLRAGALLFAVWCLACVVCWSWWWQGGASGWHAVALAAVSLLGASAAHAQWRVSPTGGLRWDGDTWWWQARGEDEVLVSVQVHLDLQGGLLVQVPGAPWRARWLYLERSVLPERWADLRRAMFAASSSVPSVQADGGSTLP